MDFSRIERGLLDDLAHVVDELHARAQVSPESILVVGAGCRDILHAALGHSFALRATTDTDLGIAVEDWMPTGRIEQEFRSIGDTGIRYDVGGLPVDIMPFGAVEDPSGISEPAARRAPLVVFGFADVFRRADKLPLPSGAVIRIPQPAGYAALKMRSWIDRSVDYNDKDGKDLALAVHWYESSSEVGDRLYETDMGIRLMDECGWDVELAAAQLLCIDALDQLDSDNARDLAGRWAAVDREALARAFVLPAGSGRVEPFARRLKLVESLVTPAARLIGA
jgi:predicted nucleotidyltransferase